jgi:DNA replication and repair protein RecF
MVLKSIKVQNFRNIKHAELEFGAGVNIFCGNNAQGKTNLLEIISVCLGKSFRNIKRGDIIPFDNTSSRVKIALSYESEAAAGKINHVCYEYSNAGASVKINDIPLKKAADLYGEFKYVVFTPDNLSLIKGEPALRRHYLDNIAIMQNKAHRRFLNEYNSALKQRCSAYFNNCSPEMLAVWDDILIRQGINLTYGRLKYLELIRKSTCEIYEELSGGEKLEILYNSNIYTTSINLDDFNNKGVLYNLYKEKLSIVNCQLSIAGDTPGAHKDDVLFSINGNHARSFGSQGQLRSIAVSLKLAEAQIIRDYNRENSVVLLDEVLGELDESRRQYVIRHFQADGVPPARGGQGTSAPFDRSSSTQVFITSCNVSDFADLPDIKIWSVDNGVFTPRE